MVSTCLIIYLIANKSESKAVTLFEQSKAPPIKLRAETLQLFQSDKLTKETKSFEKPKELITIKNNDDSGNLNTFFMSEISTPDNLPEYLLNTPFTTIDVNFEKLIKLKAEDIVSIPLFSGDTLNFRVKNNTEKKDFSIMKGVVEAQDFDLPVNLTYRRGSIYGSIATSNGEYRISKISGMHIIYKIPDLEGEPDDDSMVFSPRIPH